MMDQELLLYWAVAGSIAMFVGSLILLPVLIVLLPADYFTCEHRRFAFFDGRHPVVRYAVLILKNGIGVLLLLAGLIMLVTPGQGVLAILAGLTLLDLPGKRNVERRILGRPAIRKAMNAIRRRAGKPEFELPEEARNA
ncbi:MAG: hypothetical protein KDA42_05970 [Planctomycetales bacterium]|nr:hypothetical protein [Planctomycetales bacterium]